MVDAPSSPGFCSLRLFFTRIVPSVQLIPILILFYGIMCYPVLFCFFKSLALRRGKNNLKGLSGTSFTTRQDK